jgi:hypothetical protein
LGLRPQIGATVLADDWNAVVDAIEDRIQKFCLGLAWNRPVIRVVILGVFASIGALFLFISHREMKTEQLGAPIIPSRTKHLIRLLLIFAGLAVFMSQFLIYSRGENPDGLTKTEECNHEEEGEQREGRKAPLCLSTDRCEN